MPKKYSRPTATQIAERIKHIPDGIWRACPVCDAKFYFRRASSFNVCPECGYGFRLGAHDRAKMICDQFEEINGDLRTTQTYGQERYSQKIKQAEKNTHLGESVLTGIGKISQTKFALGIMDAHFIMGSLGSVTGEKITRLFEYATEHNLPVILFTASGGARMQEGIHSLMQMAKCSNAVKQHSNAGLLYITVLTDPTTGGVTASFAMQGDIILAEPHALIGFAGRRVIEQTIMQQPPADFQQAETLLQNGFVDAIVQRKDLKQTLHHLLKMHWEV
ncbi:acetyl-CoA carboxylase, carboxyltransferase subunit beta [Pediococcus argentinicus]|nr:acetyl-CoA carboxylase, carboxyltransferase subunit beta [Pediococcus argentinicus]GEP19237.1 acetyl-coenzyme A carboxylase carboxyl transferase subunit beta [Pediococcus argentinicus]